MRISCYLNLMSLPLPQFNAYIVLSQFNEYTVLPQFNAYIVLAQSIGCICHLLTIRSIERWTKKYQ